MTSDLRNKTLHALSWSFTGTMAQRLVNFIVSIVLARLLAPEQFGLIGMLTIFVVISRTLVERGFDSALIQKKEQTHPDECTVFYSNIVMGIAIYILLYLAAPSIAAFYSQPVLTPLTRLVCLQFLIHPFAVIQRTLLRKKLEFKSLGIILCSSGFLSGIIGIWLAMRGFGVLALVIQQLTSALFQTIFFWLANPWRPSLIFSFQSFRSLFKFGSNLMIAGVLNNFFAELYLLVIGRIFSPVALGLYSKARTIERMPSQTLTRIVSNVMFPVFSQLQDKPRKLREAMSRSNGLLTLIVFPAMLGLAVTARPMIHVILGEQWLEMTPYLQILCIVGIFHPLHSLNINVLNAAGRSDLSLRISLIKKGLIIGNIAITWRWGVIGLASGQIITNCMDYYINAFYSQKTVDYKLIKQIRDFFPCLVASIIMAVIVYSLNWTLLAANDWLLLFSQVIIGISLYLYLCWILSFPAFKEAIKLSHEILRGGKLHSPRS